jgi:type IV secretory pathway VirB2 component (pilin)
MKMRALVQKAKSAVPFKVHRRHVSLALFAIAAVLIVTPEVALAAPWDGAATKVLEIFTGGLTRTLAIIAVIACGIAAVAGKLSWDWAIKIIVGIVLIFGSTAIVDYVISASA